MSHRFRRICIITGSCVIIIVAAIAAVAHWMGGDAQGTVHVGTTKPASAAIQLPKDPLALTSSYFTTTLPADFQLKRQNDTPNGNPILLQLVAAAAGSSDEQFAVTIGTLPSDGLDGVSGYHLRTTDTATYARAPLADLPAGAVAFKTIADAPSLTVYWPHGGRYGEIAVSTNGGASAEQLQAVLAQALQNWTWK